MCVFYQLKRVRFVCQAKDDNLQETCKAIMSALPGVDVCLHYSFKWNYRQSAEESFKDFSRFCSRVAEYERASVLLVSGGGKKRKLDTLEVSQILGGCLMEITVFHVSGSAPCTLAHICIRQQRSTPLVLLDECLVCGTVSRTISGRIGDMLC